MSLTKKIPVAVLGATGMVGQKFIELLSQHPWFEIVAVAASERSLGKTYGDTAKWMMQTPLSSSVACLPVLPCIPSFPCQIVFSGLDSGVARKIEEDFAWSGYTVISNSSPHRMDTHIPLLIPEVNPDHLQLIASQHFSGGAIITNPNCSVIGLSTAIKPLIEKWGIEKMHVATMQAISGAGYPGIASYDILDNVIPFIAGEEEKIQTEPLKIFGSLQDGAVLPYPMQISAQCNRVAVMDGHMACVSIKLKTKATADEIIDSWESFQGMPQKMNLPTAPKKPIVYLHHEAHPQPKLHRHLENGMSVSIGGLRACPLLEWKFTILSHNTIRGAAGCAILNAELMVANKI